MDSKEITDLHAKIDALTRTVYRIAQVLETSPGVRSLNVAENMALVRLVSGQRLYVDSRDMGVAAHIMTTGVWEQPYANLVLKLVKQGQVCIDIGANFGYYTVLMSGVVGPSGKILSFEPNPHVFCFLERSIRANGLTFSGVAKAHNVALSNAPGKAVLHFRMGDYGGGSIFESDARIKAENLDSVEVSVDVLDAYPIDTTKPIFIKIDTEGAEYNILRGAKRLLERAQDLTIMMEFTPPFIERHIPVPLYIDFLLSLGLTLHTLEGENPIVATKETLLTKGSCYVFASRGPLTK